MKPLCLDHTLSKIRIPTDFADFLSAVNCLAVPNLIFQDLPLKSVSEYSHWQHGENFPRPSEHFVIGDYLIDLVIIAVDLSAASETYGRVIGYASGDYWVIADSLPDFAERLQTNKEYTVWGKP
jgi:hypothetical protein